MVEDVIADGLVVAQVHRAHLVDVQVLGDDRREALNVQSVPKRELELFESSVLRKEEFEWHWNLGMFSTSRFRLRDSSAGFRLGTCKSYPFLAA